MESITLTNDQEKEVQRQLDLYMTGAADVKFGCGIREPVTMMSLLD